MRRLIAIVLLLLLPLQAIWAAAEPYCQHAQTPGASQASPHVGHHTHSHDHAAHSGNHGAETAESSNASPLIDHDHHCCGALSLLSAPLPMLGILPPADWVAATVAAYAHVDVPRIERPKWPVSL
jgi:hypothetical protein